MGLDVYVHKFDDFETNQRVEEEVQKLEEEIWAEYGAYDSLTDEQKNEAVKRVQVIYFEHGLNNYGENTNGKETLKNNSTKYPEHLFKVGYFRSSYNDGGINRVLEQLLGENSDLYYVFNVEDGGYINVDWEEAKKRAVLILERFDTVLREDGAYSVDECRCNEFMPLPDVTDNEDALAVFQATREKYGFSQGPFEVLQVGFSKIPDPPVVGSPNEALKTFFQMRDIGIKVCEEDQYFPVPLKVRGIITGMRLSETQDSLLTLCPCFYFIIDKGESNDVENDRMLTNFSNSSGLFFFGEPAMVCSAINRFRKRFFGDEYVPVMYAISETTHDYEWYRQALEIVIETCDYVLSKPDASKYVLYWSS
jgi:hypothetical protein